MVSNNIVFGITGCFAVSLDSATFIYLCIIFGFRLEDGVLATYNEHEDSVYSVEWSSADPWTFASLSYDGRLVISKVPRAEKYSILL